MGKNRKKIGIPKCFIYHCNLINWEKIFSTLGFDVIKSLDSSYSDLIKGSQYTTNDQCFPVKMYFGHVEELIGQSDYIFVPQYVSLKKNTYKCPKIISIHSQVKNSVTNAPPLLTVCINYNDLLKTHIALFIFFIKLSKNLCTSLKLSRNIINSLSLENEFLKCDDPLSIKENSILILGSEYIIKDHFLNFNIFQKLNKFNYNILKSTEIPYFQLDTKTFPHSTTHWDIGQKIISQAITVSKHPNVIGVMFLSFFGCGIDAFIEEIFKNEVCKSKPYLSLVYDEHSAENHLETRIEAFIDMIASNIRKKEAL